MTTSQATRDWVRCKADEVAVDQGYWFDVKAADRVRFFFSRFLRHSKGEWAGKPFELLDWEWRDLIAPLFGWKRPTGTRRYRRAGVWVPKKNGKSALGSGLTLYMLVGDHERGAEVYNAASDRDQAGIVFNEALNMVEASSALRGVLDPIRYKKMIMFPQTQSSMKALSADVKTKEGLNWNFCLFDELHAQPNRLMFDTLWYGGAARRQPLFMTISTAGFDLESIGFEEYLRAKQIQDGVVEDLAFFSYIAEADQEKDDWKLESTWIKANPSLGHTISLESFRDDFKDVQNVPAKENTFKRYRLNMWTQQETRWIQMDDWKACFSKDLVLESLNGRPCFGGLDLASTTDIAAFTLVFPLETLVATLAWYWVPKRAVKRRAEKARTRLEPWIRAGFMEATDGSTIDYDVLRRDINALGQKYAIGAIGVDRWNATQLSKQLEGDGFRMIGFGQGFASMSAGAKEVEKLILSRALVHDGNPVTTWMMGNVAVQTDAAGNIKPSKKLSKEKIDGVVSLIISVGIMIAEPGESVYTKRKVIVV